MYTHLSTDRVIVMSRIEGVPLLDTQGMDSTTRGECMTALVTAYGVQVNAAAVCLCVCVCVCVCVCEGGRVGLDAAAMTPLLLIPALICWHFQMG